jgi:hypothetical protein
MFAVLLVAALSDNTLPPVAFKNVWTFGMNLPSLGIVVAISFGVLIAVYFCERSYSRRNTRPVGAAAFAAL